MICQTSSITKTKIIEQVVGSFLFYSGAVDPIILHLFNAIANEQNQPTQNTIKKVAHFFDYMQTYTDATTHSYASNIILNVNLDASYLTVPEAQS